MAGIVLAAIGVVVLVVAVIALQHPDRRAAGPATTRTITTSPSPSSTPRSSSASKSASASASSASSASSSRSTSTSTSSSRSSPAADTLPLVVLNNTSTPNLASRAADTFRAGGWTVTSVQEDYTNNIASTAAYYDPSVAGAQAAAEKLRQQFGFIARVTPRFSPLPAGPVVVILDSTDITG